MCYSDSRCWSCEQRAKLQEDKNNFMCWSFVIVLPFFAALTFCVAVNPDWIFWAMKSGVDQIDIVPRVLCGLYFCTTPLFWWAALREIIEYHSKGKKQSVTA